VKKEQVTKERRGVSWKEKAPERRNVMKMSKLIYLCLLVSLCIGFAGWTTPASGQGAKDAAGVAKEAEKYMPLLKGEQWQKLDSNSKVAFIWGVAHVILIENILMEEIPELRRENFSAKVVEARRARVSAGTAMTINQVISTIDQYYKDHPDKLEMPVLGVIWDVGVKPNLKTGIGGRPLK
jgi:hypothetical protein